MSHARILVVAAHPDDEILGCGGAVARHLARGDAVRTIIVGEGGLSRDEAGQEVVSRLRQAALEAAQRLGGGDVRFLGLPDNRLDSMPLLDLIKPIEREVADFQPQLLLTHHGGDLNVDHRLVHQAVITACRPLPGATVRAIYGFETVSSTEWSSSGVDPTGFRPVLHVEISAFWNAKREALLCYQGEMRPFPHPRSLEAVEALARWRGASAGLAMAESFTVIREIVA